MKKSTVLTIIAAIASSVLSAASFYNGWTSHEEYIKDTEI